MDSFVRMNEPEEHLLLTNEIKQELGEVLPSTNEDLLESDALIKEEAIDISSVLHDGNIPCINPRELPEVISEHSLPNNLTSEIDIKTESVSDTEELSTSFTCAYAISDGVDKLMQCHKCAFKCYWRPHYSQHCRRHKKWKNTCENCGHKTTRKHQFILHINEQHWNLYPCHMNWAVDKSVSKSKTNAANVELEIPVQQDQLNEEKIYKCSDCDFMTSDDNSLILHDKQNHRTRHIVKQNYADSNSRKKVKKIILEGSVQQDRLKEEKSHKCNHCNYMTCIKNSLILHVRENHKMKSKTQRKHSAKLALRTLQRHKIDKPFKCPHCNFRTVTNSRLNRHLELHLPKLQCNKCEKSFTTSRGLKRHQRIHRSTHDCSQCKQEFPTATALADHRRIHVKSKPYKCKVCLYTTGRSDLLRIHNRRHTGEKPYLCAECGYQTAYRTHLTNHQKAHNVEGTLKPYACDLCEYVAHEKHQLARHKTVHTSKRSFKCDQCEKTFKNQPAVSRHKQIHVQDKRYKCYLCSYSAIRRNSMKLHLATHTGDKPYSCPNCDYRTISKSRLKSHHQSVHLQLKPYQCQTCDFKAATNGSLVRHMVIHTREKPC